MTNVHGHRLDPTSNVDIVEVHEELVQISVLTGPQGGPRLPYLVEPMGKYGAPSGTTVPVADPGRQLAPPTARQLDIGQGQDDRGQADGEDYEDGRGRVTHEAGTLPGAARIPTDRAARRGRGREDRRDDRQARYDDRGQDRDGRRSSRAPASHERTGHWT